MTTDKDVEKGDPINSDAFQFTSVRTPCQLYVTSFDEIYVHRYRGEGTLEKPYIVDWLPYDPENPQTWNQGYKWFLTVFVSMAALAVTFCSSAYTGVFQGLSQDFGASTEVITLGISFFVLGFAVGPLISAPFSEVLGRRILFIITFSALTAFNAGAAGTQDIWTLNVLRFFAGAFGSSPLTNAGGTIADVFAAKQRGLAMTLFAAAPFMGPVLGPIVGGFTGETIGWRWVEGIMAIFTGVISIIGIIIYPETYAPVLLRWRAEKLSKATGLIYRSRFEEKGETNLLRYLQTSLWRPWIFLFREPIVLLLSIYMAIVYGILYMLFAAFPIVYEQGRGWSTGIGGLAFLGIAVGFIIAIIYCALDNRRYIKVADAHTGRPAPPEARLPPAIVGAFALPIGLFWFAWTNDPSIHFMVSISAGVPFGFGMILVFLSLMNYLIDTYVMYAASVLAANSVLRSLFGASFRKSLIHRCHYLTFALVALFTNQMYQNLGIHWASTIPACLALICLPMPYIFYKYGPAIRNWSKYSSEAAAFMARKSISHPKEEKGEVKPTTGVTEKDKDIEEIQI